MLALLGYLTADAAARRLPDRLADAVACVIARGVFALNPRARGALEHNLERLAPDLTPELRRSCARAAFEHFALSIVDFVRLRRLDPAALARAIEVRGGHHLAAASATGRGVLVLSAHLGNWEWGAAFLAGAGHPLHVLARRHPSDSVEAFFRHNRDRHGVLGWNDGPSWTRAASVLRRGEWVAMMGDRWPDPATADSLAARRSLCASAAALARRTGALILPAVMVRTGPGRYAACFEAPLEPRAAGAQIRTVLTRFLRRTPGQWLAFEPLPNGLT